jgi:serralysin
MATVTRIYPSSPIDKALFNFDEFGWNNFRLSGVVRWSVSDNFEFAAYVTSNYPTLLRDLFVPLSTSAESNWTQTEVDTLASAFDVISQFANITFNYVGNYETYGTRTIANPADVGGSDASDINVSKFYRADIGWVGLSGGGSDNILGYAGARGDVYLNFAYFPINEWSNFSPVSRVNQTFLHEVLHSLGLSHPHINGTSLSTEFSALANLIGDELSPLGFAQATTARGMYKEYFTVMSYDDQLQIDASFRGFNAYTPMLLDVIALQSVYGVGRGTHGSGSDTISAGDRGYRVYYDKGGVDTLDLSQYSTGAYLALGNTVSFTDLRIGVLMPLVDALQTIVSSGDPQHLRWLLGDYENVICGNYPTVIFDNSLDNKIYGGPSDDTVLFTGGRDWFRGGTGTDKAILEGRQSDYSVRMLSSDSYFLTSLRSSQTLELSGVEVLAFSDNGEVPVSSLMVSADSIPPAVFSFSPANNAFGVPVSSDLVVIFSESIKAGSGSILLKTQSGSLVESYEMGRSEQIAISGTTLTVNPSVVLSSFTGYRLEIPKIAITDLAGNSLAEVLNYSFTTERVSGTKSPVQLGSYGPNGRTNVSIDTSTVYGSDYSDSITGSDTRGQTFLLYAGDDMVSKGTAFNTSDTFFPGEGDDVIFAGGGLDSVIFQGGRSAYRVQKDSTGISVTSSVEGSDRLYGVERLLFSDSAVAFDIDGSAGQSYRIYKAAFNRDPMYGDKKGLGYWIGQLDRGMSQVEASARFIDSNEFRSLYGTNPTNEQFLTKLYQNVLGRQPEAAGYTWWLNELNTNPQRTKAKVLADFAESPENQTGVIGLIGAGITYEF